MMTHHQRGDEALQQAEQAFRMGDHARVRELTRPLLQHGDPGVRRIARDLRRRVSVDPVQLAIVIACMVLLAWITYLYVL